MTDAPAKATLEHLSVPVRRDALRWLPYGPAALLVVVAAWMGDRLWFFSDDWNIFAGYHSGNLTEPFNGHLSLVPAGIYQVLFHTFGVGSYLPYRVAGLVALAVLGFQVARWTSSRVGPVPASFAVVAVMWSSSGTTNVMFPFLMNFSLPIAALLAIWWHLDRLTERRATPLHRGGVDPELPSVGPPGNRELRGLLAIGAWLVLALATSGLGVVAAGAVAVELALRRVPLRWWITWSVPVAAWGVWWLGHRAANDISTDVSAVVPYAARMLLAGPTAVAAGSRLIGVLLAAGLAVTLVVISVRNRRIDPRVASALAAAVAFAGSTALTRQNTVVPISPDELRYGWTVGAYLVLAVVALARDGSRTDRPPPTGRSRITWVAVGSVVAVVLLIGAVRLTDSMADWTDQVADAAPGLRANIYSAEALGARRTPPDAIMGPLSYVPVRAQDYLDAVADVGSPLQGSTASDIGGRPEQRSAADDLLFAGITPLEVSPLVAEIDLSSCLAHLEVPPGAEVVLMESEDHRGDPVIELGRFAEPGHSLDLSRSLSALTLPLDAPVGTDAVVPYRLRATGAALVCPSS